MLYRIVVVLPTARRFFLFFCGLCCREKYSKKYIIKYTHTHTHTGKAKEQKGGEEKVLCVVCVWCVCVWLCVCACVAVCGCVCSVVVVLP
jgi:hypothetical protein